MLRIIVPIDALVFNTAVIDFACYAANLTRSRITGMILEDFMFEERTLKQLATQLPIAAGQDDNGPSSVELMRTMAEATQKAAQAACERRGVALEIDISRMQPLHKVIEESRFADLLIVNADLSFKAAAESVPGGFVRELLYQSHCPVLIAPESFEAVNEVVFFYDGSASSMFAIRQFTSLFPELSETKLLIVQADTEQDHLISQKHLLTCWVKEHYNDVRFVCLKGDPEEQLFRYLLTAKDCMVVMGSFGRTGMSKLLHKSRADLALRTTNLPMFFAHEHTI